MPYISHETGAFITDESDFRERAAFRTLTWKRTSWIAPNFGSDAVPFLLSGLLLADRLREGLALVNAELAKDAELYTADPAQLFATATEVALGNFNLVVAEEPVE